MWKQYYTKIFRNRLINPFLKKNIRTACATIPQEIDNEEIHNKYYTIEIDTINLNYLQQMAPCTTCPICLDNGWIPCPCCKHGCRECSKKGYIDCPLCQKFKF